MGDVSPPGELTHRCPALPHCCRPRSIREPTLRRQLYLTLGVGVTVDGTGTDGRAGMKALPLLRGVLIYLPTTSNILTLLFPAGVHCLDTPDYLQWWWAGGADYATTLPPPAGRLWAVGWWWRGDTNLPNVLVFLISWASTFLPSRHTLIRTSSCIYSRLLRASLTYYLLPLPACTTPSLPSDLLLPFILFLMYL